MGDKKRKNKNAKKNRSHTLWSMLRQNQTVTGLKFHIKSLCMGTDKHATRTIEGNAILKKNIYISWTTR